MNTSRVVFLLAVGVGLLFQSGCGEAKVRGNATDNTTDNTKLTAAEPQAGSTNEQGGDQENGPKIHIENPVCNFDVVGPSKTVNCTFTFKNVGKVNWLSTRLLHLPVHGGRTQEDLRTR